ncbi:hypothetical protein ACK3TF_003128 [Chlorella vulgaris]
MASLSAACKVQSLQRSQIIARPRMAAAAQRAPRSVPCGGASGLRGTPLMPRLAAKSSAGRRQVAVHASWNRGGGDGSPDIADRVVASLPYLVPLLDGLRYGKFFLVQYPAFGAVLLPLDPIIRLYYSFPLASLIVFFGIYLGIINNQNFSRYVRFNAMQAVLLDIILILPGLLEGVFRPPTGGPGLQVYISGYNTIFLFLFACVAYGVGSCLVGQTPRLPLVADAADAQVR